jgi:hypothetical protein
MLKDRRNSRRLPADLSATIVSNDGLDRVPVRVIDQSSGGVRVEMPRDLPIEAEPYLLFAHRLEPFRIAWREREAMGLAFTVTDAG